MQNIFSKKRSRCYNYAANFRKTKNLCKRRSSGYEILLFVIWTDVYAGCWSEDLYTVVYKCFVKPSIGSRNSVYQSEMFCRKFGPSRSIDRQLNDEKIAAE